MQKLLAKFNATRSLADARRLVNYSYKHPFAGAFLMEGDMALINDAINMAREASRPYANSTLTAVLALKKNRAADYVINGDMELGGVMKNVNMQGCHWIMNCVNEALSEGHEEIDLNGAMAYAEDAEYQMSLGNPPCFEVLPRITASGHVEEFEVPEEYIEVSQ